MRVLLLTSLLVGLAGFAAFGAAPSTAPLVNKLIDQLGDDDEDVRKAAETKLNDLGEDVLSTLRRAAKEHSDVDARLRAGVLAAAIEKRLFGEIRQYEGHRGWIYRMVVTPDGKKIVTLGDHLRVYDLERGKELWKANTSVWAWGLSASSDSKKVLAAGNDHTVRLYDAESGKVLQSFTKHTGEVWVAALSPDGKTAVTGGMDKALHVWDLESGKLLRSFADVEDLPRCAAFAADGKTIAVGHFSGNFQKGVGVVRVWDVQTGKLLRSAKGHEASLTTINFSPDGKTLVSSSFDKTVRLWDFATLKEKKKLIVSDQACDGVAFTPNGKRLVTAGWGTDHSVKVWDVETGKLVHRYDGHSSSVINVAVTPDGKHFVSAGTDATVRLWPMPRTR
jgi:COMPASS component SWD3